MTSRAAVNAAVKEAYDAGLAVLPPKEDGSKAPDAGLWKGKEHERRSLDELRELYRPGRHGLGVVLGEVSGNVEVFEFESEPVYRLYREHAALAGLDELIDRIEEGYLEQPPRGGRHWLWRTGRVPSSKKLAMTENLETLIETKGTGGYCILAPSFGPVHPTGKPYVRLSGSFESIPYVDLVEEREPLLQVAKSFDRSPKRPEGDITLWTPKGGLVGDRPGDDFEIRGDWAADILEPAGWVRVTRLGDSEFWRRPGKDHGHSAVLHLDGHQLFVPFSTSTPFPMTEVGYGKFTTLAHLRFHGDFSVTAGWLRKQGYGKPAPTPVTNKVGQSLRASLLGGLEVPEIETLPVLGRDGFFMKGGSNLLYSFPKGGKTDISMALVRGWVGEGRRVAYFTEEPLAFWKDRVAKLGQDWDFWEPLLLHEAMGWGLTAVIAAFSSEDDIIIVDTIRSTTGYREGEGDKEVGRVIEPIILAAREASATLICSYHARKMPGEDGADISGHHSLFGAFDRAVQLRRVAGEDNTLKRRLTVFGRLLDPTLPRSLIYEMTGPCEFRPLDTKAVVETAGTRGGPRSCDVCGNEFVPKRSDARTCSDSCRQRASRNVRQDPS